MDPRRSLIEVRRMRSKVGKLPQPYKYKIKRSRTDWNKNRVKDLARSENLIGEVQGKKASEQEELFARALDNAGKKYIFQYEILGPVGIPGQEHEIDFIVEQKYPVEVDGLWVHKTAQQKLKDKLRDQILDNHLNQYGFMPIKRIPATWKSQDEANAAVEGLF